MDRYLRDGPMVTLPIHRRQHAYQAGKSTESALHQLVGRIERAFDAKEYTLGVFFDIEGAFDNNTMDSIRTTFDDWRVHRSVRNWIIALVKEKRICVKTHNDITYASTNRGLPQGGGLSSTLWSTIEDSLLKWLSKHGVYVQGYADDGVVLVIGLALSTVCDNAMCCKRTEERPSIGCQSD